MYTKPQKPCVSGVFLYPRIFMGVQKRGGNLWICSKYAARMHQKSQQLCGQMLLSILSFSHNFVYGIDQNPDIKMCVDTFCKRHSSRMSNNLLDGSFINAVFFHHGDCSVACTVWRPLNSNLLHDCGVITVFVVSIKEVFPVRCA